MHHGAFLEHDMERKEYNEKLVQIGELLSEKRKALGDQYTSREDFIYSRQNELFSGESWISLRHLANIENGKNMISIEKLVLLADALEIDVVDLFTEIIEIYKA